MCKCLSAVCGNNLWRSVSGTSRYSPRLRTSLRDFCTGLHIYASRPTNYSNRIRFGLAAARIVASLSPLDSQKQLKYPQSNGVVQRRDKLRSELTVVREPDHDAADESPRRRFAAGACVEPIVECIQKMRAQGLANGEIAALFRHAADELDETKGTPGS